MLEAMILTSLFTLALMIVAIWMPRDIRGRFPLLGLILPMSLGLMTCSFMFSGMLLVQLVVSLLALICTVIPRYGRRVGSTLAVTACLLAWGMTLDTFLWQRSEVDSLREAYPFVSMEKRLPTPKPTLSVPLVQFQAVENLVNAKSYIGRTGFSESFERLHSEQMKDFVMAPGFGPVRMPRTYGTLGIIRRAKRLPDPIQQPEVLRDEIEPTGDALPEAKVRDFFDFHATSIGSFVNFKGFGYFKSRREVAGFVPHAFESEPKPEKPYTLERLELVGLVRNPEPVVYVSESLPRMVELETVATRPADGFEAAGLKRLAAGEDLVANAVGPKVRLLGAVRNMEACVKCHGGQRGDLLGAFSYRLAETK